MSSMQTGRANALDRKLAAISSEIAARNVILSVLKLQLLLKYDPDEPRVPAGCPTAGEWCGGGVSAHILKNPTSHKDKSYENEKGHTECVTFAQQAGGAGPTKNWKPGPAISPSNPPPVGTWSEPSKTANSTAMSASSWDTNQTERWSCWISLRESKVDFQEYSPKSPSFHGRISTIHRNITLYSGEGIMGKMRRWKMFLAGLVLTGTAAGAQPKDFVCPQTIAVTETVMGIPKDWRIGHDDGPTRLYTVTMAHAGGSYIQRTMRGIFRTGR